MKAQAFIEPDDVKAFDLDEIRKLRLWHWLEVRKLSAMRDLAEKKAKATPSYLKRLYHQRRVKKFQSEWAVHMGFVQQLNCFFSIGDTAENDEKRVA